MRKLPDHIKQRNDAAQALIIERLNDTKAILTLKHGAKRISAYCKVFSVNPDIVDDGAYKLLDGRVIEIGLSFGHMYMAALFASEESYNQYNYIPNNIYWNG